MHGNFADLDHTPQVDQRLVINFGIECLAGPF
jgi:hypothetical protein